ncbi:universal stress protein [Fulvivirga lutea]|uniref:Universal stress protein n=1 Tax=Fulvivirga lutea TaxID=2810512 RepID=A0A974WGJ5_9BACT|nr:universal stress protein [Fulvivirga lutea]QSE98114.1 universal stress protein [Fulvivirga lutea]
MHPIKRVLVALDLTDIDQYVISYTSLLTEVLGIDKVYFLHVAENLELPKAIVEKYPGLMAPADESLEDIIKDKLSQYYKGEAETSVEVMEGNAEDKILRWSKIKEIDLIVVGKKSSLKGSGLLPNRLAKIGHCSLLAVTEKMPPKSLTKILVPVDFSSSSKFALKEALGLAKKSKAKIILHNTYKVPWGYHSTGKSYEEFADIMKQNSEKDARKFMKELGVENESCSISLVLDNDDEPSDKIYSDANSHNADIIVMGSKGRTGLANILLGSIADKVLMRKGDIPVLVVKNKKQNLGILEALMRI